MCHYDYENGLVEQNIRKGSFINFYGLELVYLTRYGSINEGTNVCPNKELAAKR